MLGVASKAPLEFINTALASKNANHFETACDVARGLLRATASAPTSPWLLNVNVPDVPRADIRGTRVTRLGRRHRAENTIRMKNPRGETVYWVGAAGPAADAGEGTDVHAIESRHVSVTPLQIDLTHHDRMGEVGDWITG